MIHSYFLFAHKTFKVLNEPTITVTHTNTHTETFNENLLEKKMGVMMHALSQNASM